jgi:hypothetical protein
MDPGQQECWSKKLWFLTGGEFVFTACPRGQMTMSGDIFCCHNWRESYWHGVEAMDAAKCPSIHRAAPTTRKCRAPNVNSANALS